MAYTLEQGGWIFLKQLQREKRRKHKRIEKKNLRVD